ncbi:MAG: hypothetical protein LBF58_05395 [Deltaproteobacteria bacterium]|nr:hypothetical protein [Deltaproteobacteria bacterium]
MGKVNFDDKEYPQAIQVIDLGLDSADSSNFTLWLMGGNVNYIRNNYEKAIKYYREALTSTFINMQRAELMLQIAKCYSKIGENDNSWNLKEYAFEEVDGYPEFTQY